jgi:hypothetical protein
MAKRMVKFLQVTHFEEHPDVNAPNGVGLRERLASLGQEVEFRKEDEQRLDELGALFTKEEATAVKNGKYDGPDAASVYRALNATEFGLGANETPPGTAATGEEPASDVDVTDMSVDQVAELIKPEDGKNLTVDETVALAGDGTDPDLINKVLDAEALASNNDSRVGVVDKLEAKLAAASQG